eukprot:scaffold9999_cov54-Cylindrotheca_fusiformis.AAC.1
MIGSCSQIVTLLKRFLLLGWSFRKSNLHGVIILYLNLAGVVRCPIQSNGFLLSLSKRITVA